MVAATSAVGGAAYGCGPSVKVRRHRLPWRVKRPVRIVHVTDIHVGWSTPQAVLNAAAQAAHAARPDLTVLTGDYVNTSLTHAETLSTFVSSLPGPVFATLGNHDHWADAVGMTKLLQKAGATVLSNRSVLAQPGGAPLHIVGVDDARTDHDDSEQAFHGMDNPEHALVLSHDPTCAGRIAEQGGRLILSGHTHGGQVQIPGLTDAVGRAVGQPYIKGWYHVDKASLYVNVGLGHSRRGFRVGPDAAAELSVFDLVPMRS